MAEEKISYRTLIDGDIPPWVMRFIKGVGKAINKYGMIKAGDTVLIAASGGKDSLALALALSLRRKWLPVSYNLEAVAINMNKRERYHKWMCHQKKLQAIRKEQKAERRYFCNQRLTGLLITVLSLVLLLVTQEAVTLVGMIAGVTIIFTKKMVIYNEYYRTHGGADQWTK